MVKVIDPAHAPPEGPGGNGPEKAHSKAGDSLETIRVITDFHAAHRQLEYDGKCRFVHGHTWIGTFVLRAERFPRNQMDMSIDFGRLKDILRNLDHKMMVSHQDETFLKSGMFEPEGVVVIPGDSPSVENLARYCMEGVIEVIRSEYPDKGIPYEIEVTIQETDHNIFTLNQTVKI